LTQKETPVSDGDTDLAIPQEQDPLDAPLKITLVRKSKPFTVEHENGGVVNYKLVELNGAARDKWLTDQNKKVKYVEGKQAGMTTLEGVQSELLALCVVTEQGTKLPVSEFQKWPSSALNTLFQAAQRMNGLDKEGMEEAKKA
jgi:hypothetical protein